MTISQCPTMCEPRPMSAAAPDGDDGVGRHLLSRRHPGGDGGAGTDDRLRADVDQMLVVEGPLGEEQAGARAHPAEAPAPRVVGADRPEVGGALPGRVHQARQRSSQRCRQGTGPAHARMVGGAADPPSPGRRARDPRRAVHSVLCSPSHRTAAPDPCRLRRSARSTAASSSSSPRSAPRGWPAPLASPPAPRTRSGCRPGRGATPPRTPRWSTRSCPAASPCRPPPG